MILILSSPKETPCPRVPVLRLLVTRVVESACVAMKAGRTECPFVANSRTGTLGRHSIHCASSTTPIGVRAFRPRYGEMQSVLKIQKFTGEHDGSA